MWEFHDQIVTHLSKHMSDDKLLLIFYPERYHAAYSNRTFGEE